MSDWMADFSCDTRIFEAKRHWGSEILILIAPSFYTIKLLQINRDFKGGLQYHHLKTECGLILEGSLKVTTRRNGLNVQSVLNKNDFFFFPPGFIHQESAIVDTVILEISSPHFNDRVRLDHESYQKHILPSTSISEVITLNNLDDLALLSKYDFVEVSRDDLPAINLVRF